MDKFSTAMTVANNKVKILSDNAKKGFSGVGREIGIAMQRTLEWAGVMGVLYGSIRKIEEGVQYIKDLNKEMTNIQIITGMTNEEIQKLGLSYNKMAQELGTTTVSLVQGAVEFQRQGKTVAETEKLVEVSTKMAMLAGMQSADATEKLTAIMNGFNLEAKDAERVLDVLIELDTAYATSTNEISSAMQRSSNSAQLAGVSFNELASYITIISSVSRKNAESIGESMKTTFARLQNVKIGAAFDDEGEAISDVEKVLKRYDIVLRDSNDSFRDMSDVLEDVAVKWKELGAEGKTVDQSLIATTIAGKVYARTYSDIWAKNIFIFARR